MDETKPNFAHGIYAQKKNTEYGGLINLEIQIGKLNRNKITLNEAGYECIFVTLKTGKNGNLYPVINEYKYKNKDKDNLEEIPF